MSLCRTRRTIAGLLLTCAGTFAWPASPDARAIRSTVGAANPDLTVACRGRDGWSDEAPPARIAANVYYVGTCGITSLLITSARGHVLIDGATAEAVPSILGNVRRLGFDPRDVRVLLASHEHVDHAGGLAALKAATGARLLARSDARAVLESGRADPDDPQSTLLQGFPPVVVDRELRDGEVVRLGGLALTAHATPGHTKGSTSWTWQVCDAGTPCRTFVYGDSLTAIGAEGFRFTDHPALVARFRAAFDTIEALPCDVLITPHPGASRLFERIAGRAPLVDPRACAEYADAARRRLDERLALERR